MLPEAGSHDGPHLECIIRRYALAWSFFLQHRVGLLQHENPNARACTRDCGVGRNSPRVRVLLPRIVAEVSGLRIWKGGSCDTTVGQLPRTPKTRSTRSDPHVTQSGRCLRTRLIWCWCWCDPRTLALLRRRSAAREQRAHMRALHTRDGSASAWGALKGTGVAPTRHYRSVYVVLATLPVQFGVVHSRWLEQRRWFPLLRLR